uniref:Ig-like domain-containing protein n=1 Tax=Pundamilia nyererei TaxID=303518 RepID=A0A3B4GMI1_9CICH
VCCCWTGGTLSFSITLLQTAAAICLAHGVFHAVNPGFCLCVLTVYKETTSVLVPCQYSGILPEKNPTVMWTRNDLDPKCVHLRLEEGDDLKMQNQRYRGRTSMTSDALETADFSLTIRRPELSDSGIYTCSVSDGREELGQRNIEGDFLFLSTEPFPSWAIALMILLVLLVSGGLLFHFRHYFMKGECLLLHYP